MIPYVEITIHNDIGAGKTRVTAYVVKDDAECLIVKGGLPVPASRDEVARLTRWLKLSLLPKLVERYKYRRPGGPDPMDAFRNGGMRR